MPLMTLREHKGRQFPQCPSIDTALEEHHLTHRMPVAHPAPALKFRLVTTAQLKVGFVADEPQHVPDLLLADADRGAVSPDVATGQPIAEPSPGATRHLHMFRAKSDFLVKLPEKCIPRTLVRLDAPLGELPGILPNPLGPEYPVSLVPDDDSDVRPVTV